MNEEFKKVSSIKSKIPLSNEQKLIQSNLYNSTKNSPAIVVVMDNSTSAQRQCDSIKPRKYSLTRLINSNKLDMNNSCLSALSILGALSLLISALDTSVDCLRSKYGKFNFFVVAHSSLSYNHLINI